MKCVDLVKKARGSSNKLLNSTKMKVLILTRMMVTIYVKPVYLNSKRKTRAYDIFNNIGISLMEIFEMKNDGYQVILQTCIQL
jgi:hypothetical protein